MHNRLVDIKDVFKMRNIREVNNTEGLKYVVTDHDSKASAL